MLFNINLILVDYRLLLLFSCIFNVKFIDTRIKYTENDVFYSETNCFRFVSYLLTEKIGHFDWCNNNIQYCNYMSSLSFSASFILLL
jgi:hypothetical protein